MNKRRRRDRVWVDPDFKKALKLEAVNVGCSVIKLTRRLAKKGEFNLLDENNGKKKNFYL